jgi:hypothetical protein
MYSTVNNIFNFSYFDPDYLTSRLPLTGLLRVYCRLLTPSEIQLVLTAMAPAGRGGK